MKQARLEITDASGVRTFTIAGDVTTIGRKAESDVKLNGTDVSREHAEIFREGDRYTLRDKGSRFGTFVNAAQITEQVLHPNDIIKVGPSGGCQFVFRVDEPAVTSAGRTATSVAGDLRQVATLLEGLRAMGSGRVLDEVLAMVIDSAIDVTGAERGFIMLAGPDRALEFKVGRGKGRITLPGKTFETSRKIPEQVFETGESRIVADLLDGDLASAHVGTVALGIRHVMCVPLVLVRYVEQAEASDEQTHIGVLYLDSRERGAMQSPVTKSALETLAIEAAVAIENARLYREATEKAKLEHELKIAAAIQQGLMPAPERRGPFFDAGGATVPCRSIGGDFFEYADLEHGALGFALGDVSGKGAPAALLTAVIQGMFTVQATATSSPADTLGHINRGLVRRAVEGKFVTMFYGTLSVDGVLTYCNGGHNAPFLVRKDGVSRLEKGGMILGMFEMAPYEEDTVRLEPGDTVVVFSDGVSEAQNTTGEEYGDDRLQAILEANRAASPAQVRDRLVASVREFAMGEPQGDDITVLVVRYGA
ncbi:MAG: SpoIIE family protein phosphatase [Vicinamibacterales bacterium]|nr:SpoIIE family protein phosphatase [Vicinamibacterales bacterium]